MQENLNNYDVLIEKHIHAGQTAKAVDFLYRLAISSAKNKDFLKAEAYRERLYSIDKMALSRIVEINETIEKEKSKVLTPGFRQLWAPFFTHLSDEEANAFFFTLIEQTVESETVVLSNGELNNRLYLVRRGRLKVVYSDRDKEFLIYTLGRGDFFGHETFFSLNVCTATVKTLSDASIGYIEREKLEQMRDNFPALASKLKKVCLSGQSTFDRIRRKGMERRSFKRIKFNTQVSFQLLDTKPQQTIERPIKAELWDISKGGLCYYFHSKNSAAVRRLIGRKIEVRIQLEEREKSRVIVVPGVVHGVARHQFDEYSVHVKLARNFSDTAIKTIQNIAVQSSA